MSAEQTDAKNPAYHSRADAALLENLFDRLRWTLAFNLIIALCTLIVFSGQETWGVLLLWLAIMVGTIVLRLHIRHSFLQRVDPIGGHLFVALTRGSGGCSLRRRLGNWWRCVL